MTRKEIITNALAECETNGEYIAKDISGADLAYLRTWANRKGYFVKKQGHNAIVSIKKHEAFRNNIKMSMSAGKQFGVTHSNSQYVRSTVSDLNKSSSVKWKVSETKLAHTYLIYPDPVTQEPNNQSDLI